MAKSTAPAFEIEDFEKPTTENPYAGHVAALVEAGDGKSIKITVPTAQVAREKVKFQKAANDADRTARSVENTVDGDQTTIRFILKSRETRKGSGKPKDSDDGASVEDVPTDAPSE